MKLKVISDGVRTKVVDAETGRKIEGVTSVQWEHTSYDENPRLTITTIMAEADVVGIVETTDLQSERRTFRAGPLRRSGVRPSSSVKEGHDSEFLGLGRLKPFNEQDETDGVIYEVDDAGCVRRKGEGAE